MLHQDGGNHLGHTGPRRRPVAEGPPGSEVWLRRLNADLHTVLHNETVTRGVLARQVYQVPEDWLDDVLRVRMTDLER